MMIKLADKEKYFLTYKIDTLKQLFLIELISFNSFHKGLS